MKHHDSRLVAASLVFKLHRYARELEAKENKSPSDNRKLLAVKAQALVTGDRVKTNRVKLIGGRF